MSEQMRRALTRAGTLHEYQALQVQIARLRAVLPWTDDVFNQLVIARRERNALEVAALAKRRAA